MGLSEAGDACRNAGPFHCPCLQNTVQGQLRALADGTVVAGVSCSWADTARSLVLPRLGGNLDVMTARQKTVPSRLICFS